MRSISLLALLLALPATAFADPTGPEVLAKIDYALNCFKDAVFESKLLVTEGDKKREYGFTTNQKGTKRLVRFTSPGDIKGMGVLVEDAATMYVYLPEYKRVRRMGTHVKNQTFMGSDFATEDTSVVAFTPLYDAVIVNDAKLAADDKGKNWIVDLNVKKGIDTDCVRLRVWADRAMFQPTKLECYDASGKKLKTQERLDYHKDSPVHWQPGRIVITDHRRNDHQSEIVFTSSKIDPGLSDDLFSVRQLVRGNPACMTLRQGGLIAFFAARRRRWRARRSGGDQVRRAALQRHPLTPGRRGDSTGQQRPRGAVSVAAAAAQVRIFTQREPDQGTAHAHARRSHRSRPSPTSTSSGTATPTSTTLTPPRCTKRSIPTGWNHRPRTSTSIRSCRISICASAGRWWCGAPPTSSTPPTTSIRSTCQIRCCSARRSPTRWCGSTTIRGAI